MTHFLYSSLCISLEWFHLSSLYYPALFISLSLSLSPQVFDVMFNSQHTVVENLDIFAKVGRAVAHDEIIPFTVEDGQLIVNNERSDFDGTLVIEFVKVCQILAIDLNLPPGLVGVVYWASID